MRYTDLLLPEFDSEMATTRKVLQRVPEDKLDWRAHPKSNTIGWNANHLAEIPVWVESILTQSSVDFAPPGGQPYRTPALTSRAAILESFDRNVAAARRAIQAVKDDDIGQMWSLLQGGKPVFSAPRHAIMRSFVLNHIVHHRAILTVYFRLNGVPVPAIYGPSGDEAQ